MKNRGIGRAQIFLGALLLLATVMTWGIGLMMSPHGETVVKGTEHLRATIVTFKRNGAIGTLILCGLAAWLLFPRRLQKWPARDWALIVLLVLLSGSSVYTLIRLPVSGPRNVTRAENVTAANMNVDWGVGGPAPAKATNVLPPFDSQRVAVPRAITSVAEANGPAGLVEKEETAEADFTEQQVEANVTEEESDADTIAGHAGGADEPANDETDENQE